MKAVWFSLGGLFLGAAIAMYGIPAFRTMIRESQTSQPPIVNPKFPLPTDPQVYVWPTRASVPVPQLVTLQPAIKEVAGEYVVSLPANSDFDTGLDLSIGQVVNIREMSGLILISPKDKSYISPETSPPTSIQAELLDFRVQGRIGSPLLFVGDTIIDLGNTKVIEVPKPGRLKFGINSRKTYPYDPTGGFLIRFTVK